MHINESKGNDKQQYITPCDCFLRSIMKTKLYGIENVDQVRDGPLEMH